jgi:hypothetical protein
VCHRRTPLEEALAWGNAGLAVDLSSCHPFFRVGASSRSTFAGLDMKGSLVPIERSMLQHR